jgi:CdiI immunity protein
MASVSTVPALTLLLQAYLNLDWPDDYGGEPWAAVEDFSRSEPDAAKVIGEIQSILEQRPTESDLEHLIVDELASGYLPQSDGWTYRQWLAEVAHRVEQLTAPE